jgi:hypothetical protein
METTAEVPTNILIDNSDGDLLAGKTTTPVAEVFNTPELLESVLSHLPVLGLVIATGINKTFRGAIQASPQLQRQLFLLPTNDKIEYWELDPYEIGDNNSDRTVLIKSLSPLMGLRPQFDYDFIARPNATSVLQLGIKATIVTNHGHTCYSATRPARACRTTYGGKAAWMAYAM